MDIRKDANQKLRFIKQKKNKLISENNNKHKNVIDDYDNLEKDLEYEIISLDNKIKDKQLNIDDIQIKINQISNLQKELKVEIEEVNLLFEKKKDLNKNLHSLRLKKLITQNILNNSNTILSEE